ncbi:MAG: hypothetical protein EBZ74_10370, partial [Planctomycetia bacterium]|nr:hypothetical protein [Planctomycetia bacterium]
MPGRSRIVTPRTLTSGRHPNGATTSSRSASVAPGGTAAQAGRPSSTIRRRSSPSPPANPSDVSPAAAGAGDTADAASGARAA